MKKLLLILGLLFGGTSLAGAWDNPTLTYQTGISSITMFTVSVSSSLTGVGFGATQVDTPTLNGRVVMEIQNIDLGADLWCIPGSTQPAINGARKIGPGNSWIVSISNALIQPGFPQTSVPVGFWCIDDTTGAIKATITQMY
jgi:hypothetical protein